MIDRIHVLIFTPTYDNLLRPETVASVVAQETSHWLTWEIGRVNPYPIRDAEGKPTRDMRNVLAQYNYARELCLSGPYDALLTVEHDMIIPKHAVRALCDTPAPVVYGTYLLRHYMPLLNAWQYTGTNGLGMSLDRYPAELAGYRKEGVGRVSGVGFGCTLIRRSVLEAILFHATPTARQGPDSAFALDCVRQNIMQLARFDVQCGHIHEGEILDIESHGETVKVKVLQAVNILVAGNSVSLSVGDEVELPTKQAQKLASLSYVQHVPTPEAGVPKGKKK